MQKNRNNRKISVLLNLLLMLPGFSLANPTGGNVSSGNATFSQDDKTFSINQKSDKIIINWQRFSINQGELTRFLQPSSSSVALNRVIGVDPSSILGSLHANGQIFLLNPNGIIFGQGAQVYVGGIIASTLSMTDKDFLHGNYRLSQTTKALGAVINNGGTIVSSSSQGLINLATALSNPQGLVVLRNGDVNVNDLLKKLVNNPNVLLAGKMVQNNDGSVSIHAAGPTVNSGAMNAGERSRVSRGKVTMDSDIATFLTSGSPTSSPAAFTPATSIPAAFTPTTSTPTAFTPTTSTPTAFTPTTYTPTAFIPTTYTPTAFVPATYTPTAFIPTTYTPVTFSSYFLALPTQNYTILTSVRQYPYFSTNTVNPQANTGIFTLSNGITGIGKFDSTSQTTAFTLSNGLAGTFNTLKGVGGIIFPNGQTQTFNFSTPSATVEAPTPSTSQTSGQAASSKSDNGSSFAVNPLSDEQRNQAVRANNQEQNK